MKDPAPPTRPPANHMAPSSVRPRAPKFLQEPMKVRATTFLTTVRRPSPAHTTPNEPATPAMQPLARIAPRLRLRASQSPALRGLRTLAPLSASVASPGRAGPPPAPPATEPAGYERARKRKKQAEMLKEVKEGKGKGLKRRFWREATVREVDGTLSLSPATLHPLLRSSRMVSSFLGYGVVLRKMQSRGWY